MKNNEKIVNWCPHPISVIKNGEKITFEKSGFIARVSCQFIDKEDVFGIPTQEIVYGAPELDVIQEGYVYIVSAMVLSEIKKTNHPNKNQFVAPNTGKSIRDENGQIIGVPGFSI